MLCPRISKKTSQPGEKYVKISCINHMRISSYVLFAFKPFYMKIKMPYVNCKTVFLHNTVSALIIALPNQAIFCVTMCTFYPISVWRTNLLLAQNNTYMTGWQTPACWQKKTNKKPTRTSYHSTTVTVKSCFSRLKLNGTTMRSQHTTRDPQRRQRQFHPCNLHCVIHATKAGRNSQRRWEAPRLVCKWGNSSLWKGFTKKSVRA